MSAYEFLTFLHVAAAIIWLGAGFLIVVLILGAERAGDREREASHHRDVAWLAPRLFIPASLATLVFGLLLVIDGDWPMDQLWVTVGLVGWLVSFGLGFLYFKPEGERIGAIVAERGPADPEADRRIRRLNAVDRSQVAILFLVVADMVLKPTSDDTAIVIAGLVVIAIAAAYAVSALRAYGGARTPGVTPP